MKINTRKLSQFQGHEAGIYAICAGRSNFSFFTAGGDNVIAEWNLKSGKGENFAIRVTDSIYALDIKHDKSYLFAGNAKGEIHFINLIELKEERLIAIHEKGIFSLTLLDDGKKMIATSADGSFSVWDIVDHALLYHIKVEENEKLRSSALSNNEGLLAISSTSGKIHFFETSTFKKVHKVEAHFPSANALAFHPKKNLLISGGRDAYLRFWSLDDFSKTHEIPAHNFAIYQIAFNATKNLFATASRDKSIKIWNANTLEFLKRIERFPDMGHLNSVNNLMWGNKPNTLISVSDDRTAIAWEINFEV